MSNQAGKFPFRSGIHEQMYRDRPWTIRQYSGFGSANETNKRFRELISSGVTGLSVAFDLPTQMGLDPDDAMAIDEVGRVGVSIACLEDMRTLFKDIDLENVSVSMTINATAPILLLMYQIIAEEQGINKTKLRGTIQNDILKEFISRGTFIFPPEFSMSLCAQTFKYCSTELPNWNPISISGYHMSEAGANSVQELAFTFANALEYTSWFLKIGIPINDILERYSFFFASRLGLIQEVAKFRAAREIWAKIVSSRFSFASEKSKKLRFHAQTAGSELQPFSPELNIIRVTIQALGAILGGTQSLHTNSFDEALSLPSLYGAQIATATQQILMYETDITGYVDPVQGSSLIEAETERIISEVLKLILEIEANGGALNCLKSNFQKLEISREAYAQSLRIESGKELRVELDESQLEDLQSELRVSSKSYEVLRELRQTRDRARVAEELNRLTIAVTNGDFLPYYLKSSLVANATLGEIVKAIQAGIKRDGIS